MVDNSTAITWRSEVVPSDAKAVRDMCAATGFFRTDEVDVAVELVDERLASGPESGYHFVFAEIAGQMAGYACYGHIACTIGSYDLYWVVVDPSHQRHGVGRQLVREVERAVLRMGGRALYIETSSREQYVPTRVFYDKLGYQQVALLPDYYDDGDSKVVYARRVDAR